jgi:hypothetical protein
LTTTGVLPSDLANATAASTVACVVHGIEEVQSDELVGPLRGCRELRHRQRRRVAREDRVGLHDLVELPEVLPLDGQLLDDGLDEQVHAGQVLQRGGPLEALEQRAQVGGRQLALLDVLLELLLGLALLRVERPRGGLRHDRFVAGPGGRLRDAEAHLPRAENADGLDLHGALNPLRKVGEELRQLAGPVKPATVGNAPRLV